MHNHRLVGSVVALATLSQTDVVEMYAVFSSLYENVTEAAFSADLDEKDWVLLLRDSVSGEIRGFSTILLLDTRVHGEVLHVIFSGDTGIDPNYWGGQALVKAWAHFMGELKAQHPSGRLYWFLISKGYRTYLYLPLFFHKFYPRLDTPTPPFECTLINTLGGMKYPHDFNPVTGVIEFDESLGNLKGPLADTPQHRREHPHVRFFFEKNPGHAWGNELACVAEISAENMKGLAQRMFLEGTRHLVVAS